MVLMSALYTYCPDDVPTVGAAVGTVPAEMGAAEAATGAGGATVAAGAWDGAPTAGVAIFNGVEGLIRCLTT